MPRPATPLCNPLPPSRVSRRGTPPEDMPIRERCWRRRLAAENVGLAYSIAAKAYYGAWFWRPAGMPLDELEGAALEGLTRAALCYNHRLGWKFSTYATCASNRAMEKAAKSWNLIHVPYHPHYVEDAERARKVGRLGRVADGGEYEWDVEAVPDVGPEERDGLKDALRFLPPRWCRILRKRYWERMTLEEVSRGEGCTRERVRQIEARALRRLRERLGAERGEAC